MNTRDTTSQMNKEVVLAFYEAALNEKDFEKASRYFSETYTQHSPLAEEGKEGFAKFLTFLRDRFPQSRGEVKRVWVDGDFVILHVLEKRRPEDRGDAVVDIFRVAGGKIVEHWDVTQAIPAECANTNDMI
ncbi:putative membrane protein [Delftia acidovorans]|nr:putative membrane protein [Delftia acidovorans]